MIDFSIDTEDLSAEFNLNRQDIDNLLETSVSLVTKKFAEHWDEVAKVNLGSSRSLYRSAIQIGSKGRFTGRVYLNPAAWLPNAMEMGYSAFDMKRGMLMSPKVKHGVSGPYLTIPFRFATAGAIGESEGFAGKLPSDIQSEVNKSPSSPLGVGSIAQKHRMPKSNALRNRMDSLKSKVGKLPDNAQTSKYEGVKRNSKGSGYVNFRRVSLNSQPGAFQHPGFQELNLADRALSRLDIPHVVDIAINNFLSSL